MISRPPSPPTDIVAVDAETDGVNGFDALNGATDVETFTIGGKTYAIVTGQMAGAFIVYNQMIDVSDPTNIVEKDSGIWCKCMELQRDISWSTWSKHIYYWCKVRMQYFQPSGNYSTGGVRV